MSYQDDNLEAVYDELKSLEGEILATGNTLRRLAKETADAQADYEGAKNLTLIQLYKEEAKEKFKRTEVQRQAIYRTEHAELRLAANLKKNELAAERDYLDALKSKLMSIQSRAGILKIDHSFSGQRI